MPIALAELAAALLALSVFIACWLLLKGYRYSLGAAIRGIANLIYAIRIHVPGVGTFHPLGFAAAALTAVDDFINSALGKAVFANEWASVLLIKAIYGQGTMLWHAIAGLAQDTAGALEHTTAINGARLLARAKAYAKAVAHTAYVAGLRELGRAERSINARLKKVSGIALGAAAGVLGLRKLIGSWRGYTAKQIRRLLRLLTKLGWLSAYKTVAGLVGAGLNKLGLGWLRGYKDLAALGTAALAALGLSWLTCEFTKNVGRKLCGSPGRELGGLIDDLLAVGVDVLLLADICNLVTIMQDAAEQFLPVIHELVTAVEGVVCGGRGAAPSAIVESDWSGVPELPSAL